MSPPFGGRFGFDLGREWERSVSCEEEVVGRGSELPRLGTSAVGRRHLSLALRLFYSLNFIYVLVNTEHKLVRTAQDKIQLP